MPSPCPLDAPLLTAAEYDALLAEHGPTHPAYECFSRWLARWRELHPWDGRSDLDLVGEYAP